VDTGGTRRIAEGRERERYRGGTRRIWEEHDVCNCTMDETDVGWTRLIQYIVFGTIEIEDGR
jgi:hypothetical protein